MMCGCISKLGGDLSHHVGQEKFRPQTGWQPLTFVLNWHRGPTPPYEWHFILL